MRELSRKKIRAAVLAEFRPDEGSQIVMAGAMATKKLKCPSCGERHSPRLTCLAAWLEGLKSKGRRKRDS